MNKPKHIVRAPCQHCGGKIRAGSLYESDEYYDYYLCEVVDEEGRQHAFHVLSEKGKTKERELKALNITALTIIVSQGVEIVRKRIRSDVKEAATSALEEAAKAGGGATAEKLVDATDIELPSGEMKEEIGGGIVKGIIRFLDNFI